MAVIPEVRGVTVTIDVDGKDLPEHPDNDEEDPKPNTVYSYVEAETGVSFTFAIKFDARFNHHNNGVRARMFVDGQLITSYSHTSTSIKIGGRTTHPLDRWEGPHRVHEAISFAALKINEGTANAELWGQLGELGTIRVECTRVRIEVMQQVSPSLPIITPAPPSAASKKSKSRHRRQHKLMQRKRRNTNGRDPKAPLKPLLANDEVSEKNLKGRAISHQARLAVTGRSLDTQRLFGVPIEDGPFATFVFKYRSRVALQQLHIIPRSSSPVRLEDRPLEGLPPVEREQLLAEQRRKASVKAEMVEVKREQFELRNESDDEEEEEEEEDMGEAAPGTGQAERVKEIIELPDDDE